MSSDGEVERGLSPCILQLYRWRHTLQAHGTKTAEMEGDERFDTFENDPGDVGGGGGTVPPSLSLAANPP
jgi:hypothetical protein